jgi:hypothetical protein
VKRVVFVLLAACSSAPAKPAAPVTPAGRACVHGAEPVPASCVAAATRGKLLKDDHDAGLRIWQACEGGAIVDGAYVAERVGNGHNARAENLALFQAHQKDVLRTGAIRADYAACGTDGGDDGCIRAWYEPANEDVPGVTKDLLAIFATPDEGDVCLPFRIDTGVRN